MNKKELFSERMSAALRAGVATLHEESLQQVRDFLTRSLHEYGGFCGRMHTADLYYSFFGMECALALGMKLDWEKMREFLARYGQGEELDIVHLVALGRCWRMLETATQGQMKDPFAGEVWSNLLSAFAAKEGGFNRGIGKERGLIYETFLAVTALDERGCKLPPAEGVCSVLNELKAHWGGYANHRGLRVGMTSVTAAALTLLARYGLNNEAKDAGQWIQKHLHEKGGIKVNDLSVIPDLLSTATGLLALQLVNLPVDKEWKESTTDFVGSLWGSDGGFCGHIVDKRADLEYTFYGLMVLGLLKDPS